jgi:hypothetical protein
MNRYNILGPAMVTLGLAVMAVAGLAALQGNAGAQQKTLRQQLVGTWSFVRTEATQQDGTKLLPFGPSPRGVNISPRTATSPRSRSPTALPASPRRAA